jgi:hypothetical protein
MFEAMSKGNLANTSVILGDTATNPKPAKGKRFAMCDLGVQKVHQYCYETAPCPYRTDQMWTVDLDVGPDGLFLKVVAPPGEGCLLVCDFSRRNDGTPAPAEASGLIRIGDYMTHVDGTKITGGIKQVQKLLSQARKNSNDKVQFCFHAPAGKPLHPTATLVPSTLAVVEPFRTDKMWEFNVPVTAEGPGVSTSRTPVVGCLKVEGFINRADGSKGPVETSGLVRVGDYITHVNNQAVTGGLKHFTELVSLARGSNTRLVRFGMHAPSDEPFIKGADVYIYIYIFPLPPPPPPPLSLSLPAPLPYKIGTILFTLSLSLSLSHKRCRRHRIHPGVEATSHESHS